MKKLTTTIILLLTIMISYSQQNLFEQLAKYEGEEFLSYKISSPDDNIQFELREDVYLMKTLKNIYGSKTLVSLKNKTNGDEHLRNYPIGKLLINHTSEPSFIKSSDKGTRYVYCVIEGVLYYGYANRDDFSDAKLSVAFVPKSLASKTKEEKPKEKAETGTEKKKKKKFGAFLNDIKNTVNSSLSSTGANIPLVLKEYKTIKELKAKAVEYMASMKTKQAAPLSAQAKKDMQYQTFRIDSFNAFISGELDEFWQSAEGQRQIKLMDEPEAKSSKFTLKNNSGSGIDVVNHLGSSQHINNGSSYKFSCGNPVYYGVLSGGTWRKSAQITSGKGICGTTINL